MSKEKKTDWLKHHRRVEEEERRGRRDREGPVKQGSSVHGQRSFVAIAVLDIVVIIALHPSLFL